MSTSQPQRFEKNHVLFKEGGPATDFYVLMSGKLGVFRHRNFVRAIGGRGVFIGEMGALLGFKRSATVVVLEPATVISIPKNAEKIFIENQDIGLKLLESLRFRLSQTYDRAEKLWQKIMEQITDMIIYEASTKSSAKKSLSFGEVEAEKSAVTKTVKTELASEDFDFAKIGEFLKKLDVEDEYQRHLKEKFPRFKYVDLKKMKDLWRKRNPDIAADQYKHCVDLAVGLNEITDFITSFGTQDEETGMEEIDMLESSIGLARRSAILKSLAQQILTPKEGIEKMKKINRDIDVEIEEAGRREEKTGRIFFLSEYAKKIDIGNQFIDELRKEFWGVCVKL